MALALCLVNRAAHRIRSLGVENGTARSARIATDRLNKERSSADEAFLVRIESPRETPSVRPSRGG